MKSATSKEDQVVVPTRERWVPTRERWVPSRERWVCVIRSDGDIRALGDKLPLQWPQSAPVGAGTDHSSEPGF
jgi:hypothetical protein